MSAQDRLKLLPLPAPKPLLVGSAKELPQFPGVEWLRDKIEGAITGSVGRRDDGSLGSGDDHLWRRIDGPEGPQGLRPRHSPLELEIEES